MLCTVTGATGFIGSHLVDRLLAQRHEVRALVRSTSNLRWLEGKPVTLFQGELHEPQALQRALAGAEVVFHLAGAIPPCDRRTYHQINVQGTRRVAEACLQASSRLKRFVLVSTQAVMGPAPAGEVATEQMEPRPIEAYGESKLAAEKEARALQPRLPLCIIRPGAIYGPRDTETLALIRLAARGLRLKVGLAPRVANFCHVHDVVSAILLAGFREEARGEAFLVGHTKNVTLEEFGRTLVQAVRGKRGLPLWLPVSVAYAAGAMGSASALLGARPGVNLDRIRLLTARNWAMDISKVRDLLGYTPEQDLASGLDHTATWYREQGWLGT